MTTRLPYLTSKLQGLGTSIFAEMTQLAAEHNAINLGQGMAEFPAPDLAKTRAAEAIHADLNQYAPSVGLPSLRQSIAEHQRRFWGLEYDWTSEITVTAGATEAITATIMALCETGDEVVLFEPHFDSYPANVGMAGATVRAVTLRPPSFDWDPEELEETLSPRTRLMLLNTPHNPSGAVYTREQLEYLARLCVERDIIMVTDEVYEHVVYEGEHICPSTLPGMRDRTVQISSAGKTFSVTGWKVGWACASPPLTAAIRTAKQYLTFTNGTPFQHAIADALRLDDDFYTDLAHSYRHLRDLIVDGLTDVGFEVYAPAGSTFVITDIRPLGYSDEVEFCRMLPEKVGVVAIPCSAFYENKRNGRHLVRFAFCKTEPALVEGIERLSALRPA